MTDRWSHILVGSLKEGWNSIGSSVTNKPIAANMATCLCINSASRYFFIWFKSTFSANPKGSNSGAGSSEPGKPHANLDSSGTHPFSESLSAVVLAALWAGAKAVAEPTKTERAANNFIVTTSFGTIVIVVLANQNCENRL